MLAVEFVWDVRDDNRHGASPKIDIEPVSQPKADFPLEWTRPFAQKADWWTKGVTGAESGGFHLHLPSPLSSPVYILPSLLLQRLGRR